MALAKQDVADVDRPGSDLRMVYHSKLGGAVLLYVAINFGMETVVVPEPISFRVSPGSQHRFGGLGRWCPEPEPGNLQFVGVEYNYVRSETQTGWCLAEPLGFNPSRPGWDCPQVSMIVTGKGYLGNFPSSLSHYVRSQEFEQFVLELAVGCVFAHDECLLIQEYGITGSNASLLPSCV